MNNYVERMNRVQEYIDEHLSEKLNLDRLAEISHFSKYHFSRIFTSITGIPPMAYIMKRRLDQAAIYLRDTDKTVLEIALLCGFETASSFNSAFKRHFEKTPSELRKSIKQNSNISQFHSNKPEALGRPSHYDEVSNHNFLRRIWQMNMVIKELPDMEVAYVRHVGSYLETFKAWGKLGEWSGKHRLYPPEQTFIGISLDDPSCTEEYACRYDACVTIPESFNKDEHEPEVQYKILPGGLYAMYSFYDTIDKFGIAYQSIFGGWLPSSEYDPDDKHCLEFCMNNPAADPDGKAKIDLYIPIKKRA